MSKPTKKAKAKADVNFDLSTAADPFAFDVDPTLVKEIEEKGLVHRWINRTKYMDNRGDARGYRPYQMDVSKVQRKGTYDFQYGVDSEGYICRGDLILAVRPTELHEANKRKIARKNAAMQGYESKAADALREKTGGMKVHTGYEDEVRGYKTQGEEDIQDDE